MNTAIFKDYDVRGVYPTDINADAATQIAHAIVRTLTPTSVCIVRDMRVSGPEIKDAMAQTFLRLGVHVADAGLSGTEMSYYIAGTKDYDLVIMISASHNPPEYNGLKIVKKGPVAVTSDSGLYEIRDHIAEGPLPDAATPGTFTEVDFSEEWKQKILSLIHVNDLKPLKVVVDAGNGMAGKLVPVVFSSLPFILETMYMDLDGTFPNHIPNPLVEENTKDLRAKVLEVQADVGLTFDGDADRMFLIDDKGRLVSGTITTAMLAEYILNHHPGELILYNAICGRIVPQVIEKNGGTSMRVRVGHSYIKTYMKEYNAIFAGEHSGHYYQRDFFSAESGVLTALMVLSLLSLSGKKLSAYVDEFSVYPASGEINFIVQDIEAMTLAIKDAHKEAKNVDMLDGLSVWYDDYWFNVRASKTEPLLRLNVEADNSQLLEERTQAIIEFIQQHGGVKKG